MGNKLYSLTKLPKLSEILFPQNYELLPNTTEVFELERAVYESQLLTKDKIICIGSLFKWIDKILTGLYDNN